MVGPDWPNSGEIDIIEGVNQVDRNSMTLHTSANCTLSRDGGYSGMPLRDDCSNRPEDNMGCTIMDFARNEERDSYGQGFNDAAGGVYATEWTSSAIKIWFFPRSAIPQDIVTGTPDPSTWGTPSAQFAGDCDIDSHFQNMQIVINTTFCGAWAGAVWKHPVLAAPGCSDKARTCEDFVANSPHEFRDAYWLIQSIKVYQETEGNNLQHGVRNPQ